MSAHSAQAVPIVPEGDDADGIATVRDPHPSVVAYVKEFKALGDLPVGEERDAARVRLAQTLGSLLSKADGQAEKALVLRELAQQRDQDLAVLLARLAARFPAFSSLFESEMSQYEELLASLVSADSLKDPERIAIVMQLIRVKLKDLIERSRLHAQAEYDPLLNRMLNKGHEIQKRSSEVDRLGRVPEGEQRFLSEAILDLDDFSHINDVFGHAVGDQILVQVQHIIMSTLRKTDVAIRAGGEEIVILMPDTDEEQAFGAMERLRAAIERASFVVRIDETTSRTLTMTASIGVATTSASAYREVFKTQLDAADNKSLARDHTMRLLSEALKSQADTAMYAAKVCPEVTLLHSTGVGKRERISPKNRVVRFLTVSDPQSMKIIERARRAYSGKKRNGSSGR